jgi:hypothetical protein
MLLATGGGRAKGGRPTDRSGSSRVRTGRKRLGTTAGLASAERRGRGRVDFADWADGTRSRPVPGADGRLARANELERPDQLAVADRLASVDQVTRAHQLARADLLAGADRLAWADRLAGSHGLADPDTRARAPGVRDAAASSRFRLRAGRA